MHIYFQGWIISVFENIQANIYQLLLLIIVLELHNLQGLLNNIRLEIFLSRKYLVIMSFPTY